ncbi:MAG TPA: HAD-IB family hydrolase [Spirochaetota bacterium]|nr:HAD-IB family hydrolase [Spirochaetota bacterium]HPH03229.1 HAD-IB family hydrolase [Spirochaetota bacterium]HPN82027.1 HAD-IB family hydrolase [Spirochaetota bacterium]
MLSKPRYAFFDMDHTITRVDTGLRFLRWWCRRHPLSAWRLLLAPAPLLLWKIRILRLRSVKQFLFAAIKGRSVEDVDRAAKEFVRQSLSVVVKPEALVMIAALAETHTMVLASASPDLYVRHFAAAFGFPYWVSTRYEVCDGRYTGRMLGEDCRDEEKVRRISELVPLDDYDIYESIAFSDNVLADGPMLALAGQQFRVHPKKWQFVPWGGIRPRRAGPAFD